MKELASVESGTASATIDINGIMARIPHRYPMLLIDRVIDIVPGESATGIKNVTANEPFFQGHFPQRPIMPGVLIVEAMAQTAGIVVVDYLRDGHSSNDLVYFMTIETARFRRPVVPGDTLHLRVKKLRERGNVWRFRGEAYVEGLLYAEAVYTAMLVSGSDAKINGAA
ncbi:MAG: 3-hydroxyacyl-ACP dehydratase FabZ [Alphaproteobacteria bacterium]